jgi:restriction system protein
VLDRVDPDECLRHLKALISNHPFEVEAVRPLVDFDRSRYAFTQSVDVVAGLDHRDDLMTLTPTEFEHLVRQLFEATPGMEGWTTQASKDDGIDAVIFNATPITGGLTVVQAKQYSVTVGVQHVRELRGAMEDKKAGRGVLVTTSSFTTDARILADRFGGQVQLIDGPELIYLMKEHLDKDVLIGRRGKKKP